MYCEMFGLSALPFNNTPDPRFFYNTPDHEEALASLLYAAQQRKGFVLVTGEVGSGKTLLSRLLLSRLPAGAKTAVITNTRLSGAELLAAICRDFGMQLDSDATPARIAEALESFLLEQHSKDRLCVLILDEAQNLSRESFEELRMLGNLEADDAKLLQVLILGQPELQDTFRRSDMRQLYQRIFRTFHLKALDRDLTAGYIAHRLAVAGLKAPQDVFEDEAIDEVYRQSQGIPRLVNQICDNAMLAAYSDSSRRIGAAVITEIVEQTLTLTAEPRAQSDERSHSFEVATPHHPMPAQASPETMEQLDKMREAIATLSKRFDGMQQVSGAITKDVRAQWEQLRSASADAIAKLVRESQSATAKSEERVTRSLQEHQLTSAAAQEEMRRTLSEIRAYIDRKESRIADLAADEQASLQTARQMRQQAAELLKQAAEQSKAAIASLDAARDEVGERLAEVHREKSSLTGQFHELFEQLQEQAQAYSARNADLAERQRGDFEQSRLQVQALAEQLRQRIHGLDERTARFDEYLKVHAVPLADERKQWRADVETAVHSLEKLRAAAADEARERRTQSEAFTEESRDLLERAREETAALLASLRVHADETADQTRDTLRQVLEEAATQAGAIELRITQARELGDKARLEIEPHIQSLRAEFAHFMQEAGVVRKDIQQRVADAQNRLEHLVQRQQSAADQALAQVEQTQQSRLAAWKSQADEIATRVLQAAAKATDDADNISRALKESADLWQQQAVESHTQYDVEVRRMSNELQLLIAQNKETLATLQEQTQSASQTAQTALRDLREQSDNSTRLAKDAAYGIKSLLDTTVDAAQRQLTSIREAAETFAMELADRLGRTAKDARACVNDTEIAVESLRQQRCEAQGELRSAFEQMRSRLDNDKKDLGMLLDEIRSAGTHARTTVQVLLEQTRTEAGQQHDRVCETWRLVEAVVREADANAQRLITQAQTSAAALLEHANHVLGQAATASQESRSQCETTLGQTRELQTALIAERENLERINADAVAALDVATQTQRAAHAKTDELLSLVRQSDDKLNAALNLPQEVVRQAGEKAAVLADLSRKMSDVIKQLSTAEARAARGHIALESSSDAAEKTLDQLKLHASRVGQLVGIIRQLYGTMDARVEKIRDRLEAADALCRDVPGQIDVLRGAFTAERLKGDAPAAPRQASAAASFVRKRQTSAVQKIAPATPKTLPRPTDVAPLPVAKGSLGEIVQRNQKLNAWLRDMLGEQEIRLEGEETHAAARDIGVTQVRQSA